MNLHQQPKEKPARQIFRKEKPVKLSAEDFVTIVNSIGNRSEVRKLNSNKFLLCVSCLIAFLVVTLAMGIKSLGFELGTKTLAAAGAILMTPIVTYIRYLR